MSLGTMPGDLVKTFLEYEQRRLTLCLPLRAKRNVPRPNGPPPRRGLLNLRSTSTHNKLPSNCPLCLARPIELAPPAAGQCLLPERRTNHLLRDQALLLRRRSALLSRTVWRWAPARFIALSSWQQSAPRLSASPLRNWRRVDVLRPI